MATIGRYEVAGVIGSGGFGTVYLCTDPVHGIPVAAKVLDRGSVDDPAFLARLHREADAMRSVSDEHCVQVRDVIVEQDLAAIVTDYVDGASLRAVLARHGRLSGPQALDVLRGALRGLVAVHRAGLLHGDIKPDNILVDRRGVSRLVDFGLAAAPPALGTHAVGSTGSPAYLSPEQIRGEAADVRSDVYACAVMLFELLCGRRPYGGIDTDAVLAAHVDAPVPDPRRADPTISPVFANLCMRGLAKDRADRPASASDFLAELEDAARQHYGAAWRAGLGLGALVAGAVVAGVTTGRGASLHAGVAGHAMRGTRAGVRLGRRAAYGVGAAGVAAAGVVAIVVATGSSDRPNGAAFPSGLILTEDGHAEYAVLDTHGGTVQTVSLMPDECNHSDSPWVQDVALSPDGRSLLVNRAPGLWTRPIAGSGIHMIIAAGPTACPVGAMAWSPDGRKVAYSDAAGVWVVNSDGTSRHEVSRLEAVGSVAWSPDGARIAFVGGEVATVVVAPVAGGGTGHAALPPATAGRMQPESVTWAPGADLLFAQPDGVWEVAPDRSGLHRVLSGASSPSRGPDGSYFAAILHGRVVIADPSGHVVRSFGPADVTTVQWVRAR